MFKVSVMYPYSDGARFDHDYYRDTHMPLVKDRLGSACSYYTVEKGLSGTGVDGKPAYVAMCAFICESLEAYQSAMEANAAEIQGDILNYTDIMPILQVSEIVVEKSDS